MGAVGFILAKWTVSSLRGSLFSLLSQNNLIRRTRRYCFHVKNARDYTRRDFLACLVSHIRLKRYWPIYAFALQGGVERGMSRVDPEEKEK